jgi:hypothetical protein
MYEDQAFLAKLYLAAPVWFSSKTWLHYRQHPDSCVADVIRQGRYHEVRRYFLEWFERYIAGAEKVDARVREAVERALWQYKHPTFHKALHAPGELLRMGLRAGRRIQEALTAPQDA